MKIDQNVIALQSATTPDHPARTRGPTAPAGAAGPSTAVTTRLPLAAAGDFDAARVAHIRDAIATGRYHVDTSRIAEALLDQVRDLLGRPS